MSRDVGEVLTVSQFLRLPETKPALEFVRGRVIQKMSPKTTHSILQSRLCVRLFEEGRARDLGQPFIELRCTFGGDSLVPDIAFFARGRFPRDDRGRPVEDVRSAPDLAIEILSRGQTVKELSARLARVVRKGVRLAWLVQPTRRRVHVFRPERATEVLDMGASLEGGDVLPGFALPLSELFGWLDEA